MIGRKETEDDGEVPTTAYGCGKTTLLSCIVGRRSFDSGEVLVFGGEPGSPQSGMPGPRVGYMPQEIALFGEFTIRETLEYFGRIYRLPHQFFQVLDRISSQISRPSAWTPQRQNPQRVSSAAFRSLSLCSTSLNCSSWTNRLSASIGCLDASKVISIILT
jgi:ABC transporter